MANEINETEKKLCKEIIKIYPEMFTYTVRRDGKVDPFVGPYSESMDVGLGWYPLIKNLVTTIKENDDQYNLENGTHLVTRVRQIKEKWGSLRFYVTATLPANHKAIEKAERDSNFICETCGSKEDVGQWTTGWIKTCCKSCAQIRYDNIDETIKGSLDQFWRKAKEQ